MKHLLFLFLLVSQTLIGQTDSCFPAKNDKQLVYDEANLLDVGARQRLEDSLQHFAIGTSNQIVVVIVPDLCGYEPYHYATELGEKWGVGQKDQDNGIVVLVKPKTPESEGRVHLAIGRGLEGAIPDATTYLIVNNEMIPAFKRGDLVGGISKGVHVLSDLAAGEYTIANYAAQFPQKKKKNNVGFFVLLLGFLLVWSVFKFFSVRKYAAKNNLGFWAAFFLLQQMSNQHRGYWDDFRGGRGGFGGGGFGGGGGGGFGGFGGGSFGGGGSGGSW